MMRFLGYLLLASMALALLQAALKVTVSLVILGALATFVTRPRETIALMTMLGVLNLVAMFPLQIFGLVGGLVAYRLLSGKPAQRPVKNDESVRRLPRIPVRRTSPDPDE